VRVRCPCGIFFVVVVWGPGCGERLWWLCFVFVALLSGDLFVHSSVRGVWFVGFGAALCVLCVCFVFLWIVGVWLR